MIYTDLIIYTSVISLALASIEDMKTGEIPEKLSIGLVFTVLVIASITSVLEADFLVFLHTLFPGLAFFFLGFVLFYLGQWGGGDVKLVAGIGCALGFLSYFNAMPIGTFPYFVTYFVNMMLIAFPYATIYGIVLGFRSPETFAEFTGYLRKKKTIIVFLFSFAPSLLAMILDMAIVALLYLMIPLMFLTALYLKAVEKKALQKTVDYKDLREGDVVAEDLYADDKKIASRRDIEGFSKDDIENIKKFIHEGKISPRIKIKWGIKFAPVLFFALLSTIWIGNFVEIIMDALLYF